MNQKGKAKIGVILIAVLTVTMAFAVNNYLESWRTENVVTVVGNQYLVVTFTDTGEYYESYVFPTLSKDNPEHIVLFTFENIHATDSISLLYNTTLLDERFSLTVQIDNEGVWWTMTPNSLAFYETPFEAGTTKNARAVLTLLTPPQIPSQEEVAFEINFYAFAYA